MGRTSGHHPRREALTGVPALGAGIGIDRLIDAGGGSGGTSDLKAMSADSVPFYASNQAGIATPAQEHLCFAAFDVPADGREQLLGPLERWTRGRRDVDRRAVSHAHRVTREGEVIHQHQEHIGKYGDEQPVPNEWIQYPYVGLP